MKTTLYLAMVLSTAQFVLGEPLVLRDSLAPLESLPEETKEVVIEPGVYRLPEKGLQLSGLSDVSIQAEGVTWMATNPTGSALTLRDCSNLSIQGLTIDYDPLPYTQGKITAFDREERTAEVEIDEGYPLLSDLYLVNRMHLFEPDVLENKPGSPDYYLKGFERLSESRGRITFRDTEPGLDFVNVGDRVAFNPRSASAIRVLERCSGLSFKDVTLHASPGLGVLVRFAEESGTYENFKIVPGPKPEGASEERLMSTCADAFNAAYTRKGPVLDGCEFAFMGDDSLNLHGAVLPVLKWMDDQTFLTMRPLKNERFDLVIREGDEVRFLTGENYGLITRAEVEEFEIVEESYEMWRPAALQFWPTFKNSERATFFRVRLKEPVSGVPVGSISEYPITAAPDFVIRDSYFHDHRARGLRIMAENGVIENNRFERIKDAGISLGPEFAFWRESGWVENVVVRNNTFFRVGEGMPTFPDDAYTFGVISVFARVEPNRGETIYYPGNRNLLIENNDIRESPRDGIHIFAATEVTVRGNRIEDVNQTDMTAMGGSFGLTNGQPITVNQASVLLEGNTIVVDRVLSPSSEEF